MTDRELGDARMFSAASGRGLIEANAPARGHNGHGTGFPRHRAAASLKPLAETMTRPLLMSFPRHRAAASLKLRPADRRIPEVFRGIGPRPH